MNKKNSEDMAVGRVQFGCQTEDFLNPITVNSRLAVTSLLRTTRYNGQELKSRGIRITEKCSRCYRLSLL